MKLLKRSINAAYKSVYGSPPNKSKVHDITNVASLACSRYFNAINGSIHLGDTVLLNKCVYTELMKFDPEVAVAYILYSTSKHLSMKTGTTYTYDLIYDAFNSRREKPQ